MRSRHAAGAPFPSPPESSRTTAVSTALPHRASRQTHGGSIAPGRQHQTRGPGHTRAEECGGWGGWESSLVICFRVKETHVKFRVPQVQHHPLLIRHQSGRGYHGNPPAIARAARSRASPSFIEPKTPRSPPCRPRLPGCETPPSTRQGTVGLLACAHEASLQRQPPDTRQSRSQSHPAR